jgi:hypothetical protein
MTAAMMTARYFSELVPRRSGTCAQKAANARLRGVRWLGDLAQLWLLMIELKPDEAWEDSKQMRSRDQTQAAQFAVTSELCKRGYQVGIMLGNHPGYDLMVMSRGGVMFPVEVKGQYQTQYWQMGKKAHDPRLHYIFAHVPDGDERNRFFVMDQTTVDRLIDEHREACGNSPSHRSGILWRVVEEYENKWSTLPGFGAE